MKIGVLELERVVGPFEEVVLYISHFFSATHLWRVFRKASSRTCLALFWRLGSWFGIVDVCDDDDVRDVHDGDHDDDRDGVLS